MERNLYDEEEAARYTKQGSLGDRWTNYIAKKL